MRNNFLLFFLFSFLIAKSSFAQDKETIFSAFENQMIDQADTFLFSGLDEQRINAANNFIPQLIKTLKITNSFTYEFPYLSKKINIIYPPDSSFRIFNWEVKHHGGQYRYYGAIQLPDANLKLFPLIDYSSELEDGGMDSVLKDSKWYGGLIYEIVEKELPDHHKIYTLLSFNRAGLMTNKKIMDILIFVKGKPIMGIPNIHAQVDDKPKTCTRFIMEFNKNAKVSMNYDSLKDVIYYDVLASEINNDKLKYSFIPIGDMNAFHWDGQYWNVNTDFLQIQNLGDGNAPIEEPKKKKK